MKPWYPSLVDRYGSQLVVDGKPLTIRQAAELTGISVGASAPFMRWFLGAYHPELAARRASGAPRGALGDSGSTPGGAGPSEAASEPESLSEAQPERTWTDERSGTVFTDLGPDYGVIMLTQGEFRSLRRDYSRLWGGKAMNQSEIAYKYRFPSAHAVEVFKRIHGLRQTSIPFTDTEIEEEGVEALVDKTIESQRQKFFLDLQEKERSLDKRDAEKWRALEVSLQLIVASIQPMTPPAITSELLSPPASPYALIISLTDAHMGKLCYGPDGRVIWNRAITQQVIMQTTRDLLRKGMARGRPDEIVLMLGSDGVHVDGPALTTSGGTSQAEQSDGTYREMVEDYLAVCREVIDLCRTFAPVRAVMVEGNHDRTTAMMIGMMLEQLYAGDTRVTVERQRGQGLILINYGETTLVFLHGEYLRRLPSLFPAVMALAHETGLALQRYILSFSGHLHHECVTDLGVIKHHTLTSPTPPDEWHRRALFNASTPEVQAFIIRRSGGKEAVLFSDPESLRAS